jgi:hypothetical protein
VLIRGGRRSRLPSDTLWHPKKYIPDCTTCCRGGRGGIQSVDVSSCMLGCTTSGNAGDDERATGRDTNCTHVIQDTLYPPAYIAVCIVVAGCLNIASLSISAGAFKLHSVRWCQLWR